ncbi:Nin one binding Zn-ribbon like-domain-containing protein [Gamsiella multidivaricata]|uniref:Nin one binding Zn-ribbon like-domain-containing protein n=1 Tax=Gamsiella multidivaricata TaxID=101098 RepID=UPI0022200241|nr:Nin one binding Zn-ribbon like-domain-containing protein [Gamsiella multidivaricata]KAI7823824.1 Nin one binding Zn-ribbon like-domain-containing protein [Gamsiella multidivaricata]
MKLRALADKFYTIPEVLNEIRDRQARNDLAMLPFDIQVINPTEASVRAVAAFSRKTGDYAVLSATDLRVLALTYQLELENCGMKRIRTEPHRPNVQAGNKKPAPPKRTKHSAKEITGDFEEDESTEQTKEGQEQQETNEQGNTVLVEESDDEDEDEVQVQDITDKLDNMSTAETAVEEQQAKSSTTVTASESVEASEDSTANAEVNEGEEKVEGQGNEDDDDDGEWITPENVKKFKRHGTLKSKKKVRQPQFMQVACTTGDYAMQNVLLQMGLNLLSIDGLRISKVKSWVLRCHACTKVTSDMEKKFCPSCGNSTLMRTSTSTDQNGNVKYYLKKNMVYNLRGTKYSIPAPKGGRKNNDLILREDQREYELSMKFQRRQKKIDAFDPDYVPRLLEGQIDVRNPFGAPVIGYGKRNPNAVKKNQTLRRRR